MNELVILALSIGTTIGVFYLVVYIGAIWIRGAEINERTE